MNDHPPGADNPRSQDITPLKKDFTPLSNMEGPGVRTRSTPLDQAKMHEIEQGKSNGDELIMRALQQSIKDQKNGGRPDPDELSPHLKYNIDKEDELSDSKLMEPKKVDNTILKKPTQKKDISTQQGFLMPFVNWFNGLFNGAKDAVIRVIMKQPTPSRGTA